MAAARIRSCRWTRYSKMKCPLRAALSTAWRARPPGKCSGLRRRKGPVPTRLRPRTVPSNTRNSFGNKACARIRTMAANPIQIPSASFREIRASTRPASRWISFPRGTTRPTIPSGKRRKGCGSRKMHGNTVSFSVIRKGKKPSPG